MKPEQKMAQLNLKLPKMQPPIANFVYVKKAGNLVYVAGHAPVDDNGAIYIIPGNWAEN